MADARAVLKDGDLQAHYDLLFELFASPAWARFVEEVKRFGVGVNDIRRLKNEHGLGFAQGQLDVLTWLAGYEEMTRKAYEIMLADDNPTLDIEASGEAQIVDTDARDLL